MFNNVEARYALRAFLAGVAAFVSALTIAVAADGAISGSEALQAALAGVSSALAYAGIGALSPSVEPSIGRKRADEGDEPGVEEPMV